MWPWALPCSGGVLQLSLAELGQPDPSIEATGWCYGFLSCSSPAHRPTNLPCLALPMPALSVSHNHHLQLEQQATHPTPLAVRVCFHQPGQGKAKSAQANVHGT